MKLLRYLAIVHAALTLGNLAFGEELTTLVDARRSGGTSTGTFVGNALPSFLLAPTSGTFGIRNASSIINSQWEFAIGSNNQINPSSSNTISLSEISTFRNAASIINDAGMPYNLDRFNPTDTRYLFGKVGTKYYAFQIAKWSNNNQSDPSGDRIRFYGASEAIFDSGFTTLTVIPEPSSVLAFTMGVAGLLVRRRR